MTFREKLTRLMENAPGRGRIAQDTLAEMVGVSQNKISTWKTGKTYPDIREAWALAVALGVDLTWLANDEQDEPPRPELDDDEQEVLSTYRRLKATGSIDTSRAISGLALATHMEPPAAASRPPGTPVQMPPFRGVTNRGGEGESKKKGGSAR